MRRGAAAALVALLAASWAGAIRPHAAESQDAERFGLDRLEPARSRRPSPAAVDALGDFKARRTGKWDARFDPRTGAASSLLFDEPLGGVSPQAAPAAAAPATAAAAFLEETRDITSVDPAALVIERQNGDGGRGHLLYRQTYKGLPVEFARVKVHVERGAAVGLHSRFEPGLKLDVVPSLSAAAAFASVRGDLGAPGLPQAPGELVVLPLESSGRSHLAWRFSARARFHSWRYYVDAHDGAVLLRFDELRRQGVCLTSGTVTASVYAIDPTATPAALRPINHMRVYVGGGTDSVFTQGNGTFCSPVKGKISAALQGPFVNVGNFRGPGAHYDNGSGVWSTVATPVSSPHPYQDSSIHVSTINLAIAAPSAVKVLPIFSTFRVGQFSDGDVADDDELQVIDAFGDPVASYIGNRGAFNGAAVHGPLLRLRLRSNNAGTDSGYDVAVSSYLTLTDPTEWSLQGGSFTWTPAHTQLGKRSEINLFYHLNEMHAYFMRDVNISSAAFIGKPVSAMALVGPDMNGAFYNPHSDGLFFGDVSGDSPSDALTDDATVPRHEYVHYLVEKLWSIQNFGQAGAISEAVADYFSGSSLETSAIGKFYARTFDPFAGPLREMDCPTQTSCRNLANGGWSGEIHEDSLYLSQALWDVRKAAIALFPGQPAQARSCADGLVFQSLLYFPESFQEFYDAMRRADLNGTVAACGGASAAQGLITTAFSAHGLISRGGDAYEPNDGFHSAVDVSTLGALSATVYPLADEDVYSFGAGGGLIRFTLNLPPSGFFYKAYTMTLYDRNHIELLKVSPRLDGLATVDGQYCQSHDCTTSEPQVVLNYSTTTGNFYYLKISGGPTVPPGNSNSGVSSTEPYELIPSFSRAGAFDGAIVSASFDNDVVSYGVTVTSFVRTQDYRFAYAQLVDHAFREISGTRTDTAVYLSLVSSSNALGRIEGRLRLQSGFARRFPSNGTVHLEVFAYNVAGSTVSMGLSNALNLTTNRGGLTAYNNVFNPRLGQRATIKYETQKRGQVSVRLYTLDGTLVRVLFEGEVAPGKGSVDWNGRNLLGSDVASGVYLIRLSAPGLSETKKVVVVK